MENLILVIDNYDSFTYNLVQYIGELGYEIKVKRNNEVTIEEIKELNPDKIVISPGPGRPEDAGISLAVVKELAGEIPILGVCLGHQTIGAAYGGKVVKAPELVHGKTANIVTEDENILKGIDNFKATRYHSLVLAEKSLAPNFAITSRTDEGLMMSIADEEQDLYGVQFHPESIMTEHGKEILNNFLKL
ncbi:anthranilate synthase component II [Halanaerobacter jeridensis]|uniref:Anthranilate synthase/aminodeoxychorismate synthase-like glutamine amidotransferase n=1 Tax=Halanaerobacter jeridensis TaxID=706427 RepID=A0A938XQQ8_9FIRM|nr:anthranilate synthase/aminodeoxychorismate synthase-like glutamine amidotransferase [Halanaerobacter jeridensis]